MAKGLTDEQIKVIVDAEIDLAMGEQGGELSEERSTAMERYLGEPDGKEMEGRSTVQARDVMDVIEWILPSLIRMFASTQASAVELDPVGPEDELQAQQETDFINYIFWKKNDGFLILYTIFKDALLSKTGIPKTFVEEYEGTQREGYTNMADVEYQSLLADDDVEVLEHTENSYMSDLGIPMQTHDVVIKREQKQNRICVIAVPPEEFLISTDASNIDPKEARFTGQHTTKTVSDLIEMGFSEDDIKKMEDGPNAVEFEEERYQRMHLDDEQRYNDAPETNEAMRLKKLTEGYLRADRDGDGIAEMLQIFRSGDFIEIEDVDNSPFSALTPVILTHKFFGLSVADLITDIQEIRTGLFRAYMDNVYQTINGTTYYDENTVNVEDMLTSKPHGIRAVDGAPANAILHIPASGLPPESFSMMDLMKDLRADRIGDFQSQLDPNVLANANNGVVVEMLNEAKAKVEMIARIFAETGVKSMFRDIHELARKHGHHEEVIKLRNQWVPVDPKQWLERTDFTVNVGLGIRNKQEEAVSLKAIMEEQIKGMEIGQLAPMMMNQQTGEQFFPYWESQKRYAEVLGEANPDKYFPHPTFMPPPPPPQPDPNQDVLALTAQVEAQKDQTRQMEIQLKAMKEGRELEIKAEQVNSDISMNAAKQESVEIKQQMEALKAQSEAALKELDLMVKAQANEDKAEFDRVKLALEQRVADQERALQKYEADLNAATDLLTTKNGQDVETPEAQSNQADQLLATLLTEIKELKNIQNTPKQVVRDADGNITQIGNQRVLYDESGLVSGLE